MFLRPKFGQPEDIFAVMVLVPAREAFEGVVVLPSVEEAFLLESEGLLRGFVF